MDTARRRIGVVGSFAFGGARTAALLLQRLVSVGQFVGDDEGREQQQPRFADLADAFGELADPRVDVLRRAAECAAPARRRR